MTPIATKIESLFKSIRTNNSFILVDGVPIWNNWHDDEFVLLNKAMVADTSGGLHKLKYSDCLWSVTDAIEDEMYTPCYPYFEQGTIREIVKSVNETYGSITPFPLAMFITTAEAYNKISEQEYECPVRMYLSVESLKEYRSYEREEYSYQDQLLPLLKILERYLDRNVYLHPDINPKFRPRWGRDGIYGIDGSIFTDLVDALEIETNLTFNINC